MIYTSSHKAWQSTVYETYSISGNRGKDEKYNGKYYKALAPLKEFWIEWHNNIEKKTEEENNRYYIREYWRQVLSKLDPREVYEELDNSVLLCYENSAQFCHRHIIAAWFEILLGVKVVEASANGYQIKEETSPEYIRQYNFIKQCLEEVIRSDRDMQEIPTLGAPCLKKTL